MRPKDQCRASKLVKPANGFYAAGREPADLLRVMDYRAQGVNLFLVSRGLFREVYRAPYPETKPRVFGYRYLSQASNFFISSSILSESF